MIIEPCCCHKQLPQLCRSNEHRITPFHTNGDVTIEKVFHAIGCLVGPSACTIIIPSIDNNCAQYLKYALTRNWITSLQILTAPDTSIAQPDLGHPTSLLSDLGQNLPITHLTDKRITEASSIFILEGEKMRLCITGYLPPSSPADTDNIYRLVNHTILYTNSEPPQSLIWDELTHIPTAPFRMHRK